MAALLDSVSVLSDRFRNMHTAINRVDVVHNRG